MSLAPFAQQRISGLKNIGWQYHGGSKKRPSTLRAHQVISYPNSEVEAKSPVPTEHAILYIQPHGQQVQPTHRHVILHARWWGASPACGRSAKVLRPRASRSLLRVYRLA